MSRRERYVDDSEDFDVDEFLGDLEEDEFDFDEDFDPSEIIDQILDITEKRMRRKGGGGVKVSGYKVAPYSRRRPKLNRGKTQKAMYKQLKGLSGVR